MEKILIKSKEEFKSFEKENSGYLGFYGNTISHLEEPEKYPCIIVWDIMDNPNGPCYLRGETVYLEDFE